METTSNTATNVLTAQDIKLISQKRKSLYIGLNRVLNKACKELKSNVVRNNIENMSVQLNDFYVGMSKTEPHIRLILYIHTPIHTLEKRVIDITIQRKDIYSKPEYCLDCGEEQLLRAFIKSVCGIAESFFKGVFPYYKTI